MNLIECPAHKSVAFSATSPKGDSVPVYSSPEFHSMVFAFFVMAQQRDNSFRDNTNSVSRRQSFILDSGLLMAKLVCARASWTTHHKKENQKHAISVADWNSREFVSHILRSTPCDPSGDRTSRSKRKLRYRDKLCGQNVVQVVGDCQCRILGCHRHHLRHPVHRDMAADRSVAAMNARRRSKGA